VQIGMNRNSWQTELDQLNFELSSDSMQFLPEYKQRINVLEELKFIKDGCLELKGKVACLFKEHEIVLTEVIFDNILQTMTTEEIAGLLSGFVFQQKVEKPQIESPKLKENIDRVIAIATNIGEVQNKCGIKETVGDFVEEIKFGLCNVCYQWAEGKPFKDIVEGTDIQEGIIVRALQRMDEVISDIKSAAEIYGDTSLGDGSSLMEKMDKTSQSIRRDIVFSASLYTQVDDDVDIDL